ncbi:MAG: hypothetical protein GYB36_10055 [Alphaproteobacteria bacterium]|nr:hypothetical protein [Alphaproteobacteria bacterium]
MNGQVSDLVKDARWYPDAVDVNNRAIQCLSTTRERLVEAAFLDQRMDRNGLQRRAVALTDLQALSAPAKAPRFIWHTAFCCSTLLARCLDRPGSNFSLKEPAILMGISNIKRNQGEAAARNWLDPVLKLLARPMSGEESVTIKPTNLVNNLVPDVMALSPQTQHVFLTSELRAFLISIAKKGEAGRAFARQMFTIFAMDGHPIAQTEHRQLMQLSDLQIAALVWHMQITVFQAALKAAKPGQAVWMDGDDFVSRPELALTAVDKHFDLGLGEAFAAETAKGPILSRDSKDQSRNYKARNRAAEAEKIAQSLGSELDAIIQWSYSLFPHAPRNSRLDNALLPQ